MIKKILISLIILSLTYGQYIPVVPELVPYQIVPIDPEPDCRLEVGIVLLHPYDFQDMATPQERETLEVIYKRIGYEVVNPSRSAGMFQIDNKLYHLIRIPYTAASEHSELDWN